MRLDASECARALEPAWLVGKPPPSLITRRLHAAAPVTLPAPLFPSLHLCRHLVAALRLLQLPR